MDRIYCISCDFGGFDGCIMLGCLVMCWLKIRISHSYNIFLGTFGATGVWPSHSAKWNQSIEPNFKCRVLNFWGGQLLRVWFKNLSFLRELKHYIFQGNNYSIYDHFGTHFKHFQSDWQKSKKIVEFDCPTLYLSHTTAVVSHKWLCIRF